MSSFQNSVHKRRTDTDTFLTYHFNKQVVKISDVTLTCCFTFTDEPQVCQPGSETLHAETHPEDPTVQDAAGWYVQFLQLKDQCMSYIVVVSSNYNCYS